MLGIIAGEIIGSPFNKENVDSLTNYFFPIFEARHFSEQRPYSRNRPYGSEQFIDRVYEPSMGAISEAVLGLGNFGSLGEEAASWPRAAKLCAAAAFGKAALSTRSHDEFNAEVKDFASKFGPDSADEIEYIATAAYQSLPLAPVQMDYERRYSEVNDRQVISDILSGRVHLDQKGDYVPVEPGEEKHSDSHIAEAAFSCIASSSSWEEAVRKAVALGGDSSDVAALTGGLAECIWPVPDHIAYKAKQYLNDEQLRYVERADVLGSFSALYGDELLSPDSLGYVGNLLEVKVLVDRMTNNAFYTPLDGQEHVLLEQSVKSVNPNAKVVSLDELDALQRSSTVFMDADGRVLMGSVDDLTDEQRKGVLKEGKPFGGAFLSAPRAETRTAYFDVESGRLYSPFTAPLGTAEGFKARDERILVRSQFEAFKRDAEAIRNEQESRFDLPKAEGADAPHMRFSNAYYLDIQRDKVVLMKGDTPYGAFGIDKKGRLSVNTNVIGGSNRGEYLQGALDNQKVFRKNDGPKEVLLALREKCLDFGFTPDEEGSIKSNADLMEEDVLASGVDLPVAAPCASFAYAAPAQLKTVEGVKGLDDVKRDVTSEAKPNEKTNGEKTNDETGSEKEDEGKDKGKQTNNVQTAADKNDKDVRTFSAQVVSALHQGAVFTVGHSNLSFPEFLDNLKKNGIQEIRDVRSYPKSKMFPQFDKDKLKELLEKNGIKYTYCGDVAGGHVERKGLPNGNDKVSFTLSTGSYAQRTKENARNSDITIAFAKDFTTKGEELTAEAAKGKYLSVGYDTLVQDPAAAGRALAGLLSPAEKAKDLKVNIAGNGIYTFKEYGITQEKIDALVEQCLRSAVDSGMKISKVISGGQTGVDESGIKAAMSMGIPAEVHAPKDWRMRLEDNWDRTCEHDFKERFMEVPPRDLSYAETVEKKTCVNVLNSAVADAEKRVDDNGNVVKEGTRIAFMCSEGNPLQCHRFAMLGYALTHPELVGLKDMETVEVQHIKRDGTLVSQQDLERKVCKDYGMDYNDDNLKGVMEEYGAKLQNPAKKEDKAINLSKGGRIKFSI